MEHQLEVLADKFKANSDAQTILTEANRVVTAMQKYMDAGNDAASLGVIKKFHDAYAKMKQLDPEERHEVVDKYLKETENMVQNKASIDAIYSWLVNAVKKLIAGFNQLEQKAQ